MANPSHYLALDLGAESGRAVHAVFESGLLRTEEVHRFPNEPIRSSGDLHWDTNLLWSEVRRALALTSSRIEGTLDGIGVDTWGSDFGLLGENGQLIDNPFHYRDARTQGMIDEVCKIVSAEALYDLTAIQFLEFNTLFQLYAVSQKTPELLAEATHLLTMADLLNYWLTGRIACEYTIATTTHLIDARARTWANGLLRDLNLPSALLAPIRSAGCPLGPLLPDLANAAGLMGATVYLPACHDTGSAVAAIKLSDDSAFISSGTWSLMGVESKDVIINEHARRLNFTNEGGVCGTIRFLKNINGLWLVQQCARQWRSEGYSFDYSDLSAIAAKQRPLQSLIDPDDVSLMRPTNMPAAIAAICRKTDQPVPRDPADFIRVILDSLALKYRYVLDAIETLTGKKYREIRIVGGGASNLPLNQSTANATSRRVVAGPIEATALGNIAMQLLAAGAVGTLSEARSVIDHSYQTKVFEPADTELWDRAFVRFRQYFELGRS